MNVVLVRVSMLAMIPISTFVQPYGSCMQVVIGIIAPVDTRTWTTFSVGFVYESHWN